MSYMCEFYSERPRGVGFKSVNPAERWRENPARALARAGFSQHLDFVIRHYHPLLDGRQSCMAKSRCSCPVRNRFATTCVLGFYHTVQSLWSAAHSLPPIFLERMILWHSILVLWSHHLQIDRIRAPTREYWVMVYAPKTSHQLTHSAVQPPTW